MEASDACDKSTDRVEECESKLIDICSAKCDSYRATADRGANLYFKDFDKKDVLEACTFIWNLKRIQPELKRGYATYLLKVFKNRLLIME